jgi:hypothetical protein
MATREEIIEKTNVAQDAIIACKEFVCGVSDYEIHLTKEAFKAVCNNVDVSITWLAENMHLKCVVDNRVYVTCL